MSFGVKLGKLATFEFNPQGNIWYKDETTYGHKMLSRMGWQKGKGLGRNEDGIKENLQVTKKYDNTGVGWKNGMINSVGCTEYDNILKKLQETFNKDDKKEEKSGNSETLKKVPRRSHLYFRKFEKELSDCSEKDLKCIFIENSKELSEENVDSNDEKSNESSKKEEIKKTETPTFKSTFSIQEYFAEKMKKKNSLASNHETKKDSKEDESFISAVKCETPDIKIENISNECENSSVYKKSKRKRKRDLESEELMSALEGNATTAENEEPLISVIKCETSDIKVENTSDNVENSSVSRKSKKKRKRDLESEELMSTLVENTTTAENEDSKKGDSMIDKTSGEYENFLVSKKLKKKRKHYLKWIESNEKENLESEEMMSNSEENVATAENDDSKVESIIPAVKYEIPSIMSHNPSNDVENSSVIKKSKKKRRHDLEQIENNKNVTLESDELISTSDENAKVAENERMKHKKKKSKKNKMSTLEKIKSCLKKKSYSFNFKKDDKKVCFNELVSYKILDSDNENTTDQFGVQKLNFEPKESIYIKFFKNMRALSYHDYMDEIENTDSFDKSEDCNYINESEDPNYLNESEDPDYLNESEDHNYLNEPEDSNPSNDSKNTLNNCIIYSSSDSEEEGKNVVNDVAKSQSEESSTDNDQKPACMNIPKCSASNFNFWLESQRAAMKMKPYQDMFATLKTHPVFKTTNLLDIKGYGNW